MSKPTIDGPEAMTRDRRLIAFASCVLDLMELTPDWDASMLDEIATDAQNMHLAGLDEDGMFEVVE